MATGDFTILSQQDYDTTVAPTILLDAATTATLNIGVGLAVTGSGSAYIPGTEFNTGDVIAIKSLSGVTLLEHTVAPVKAYSFISKGFVYLFDENGNSLLPYSAIGTAYLKVAAGTTLTHVYYHTNDYSDELIAAMTSFIKADVIFANPNMTPEEAIAGLPVFVVNELVNAETVAMPQFGFLSLFNQQGEQRETGYFQSTVTVSGVPVAGMKVFCFSNYGELLGITYSDKLGAYRFDDLLLGRKYMFVAQHDDGDTTTPPEYLATASDWQSPTAY